MLKSRFALVLAFALLVAPSEAQELSAPTVERSASKSAEAGEDAVRLARARLQETARRFPSLAELTERNQALAALRAGETGLPQRIARERDELVATEELLAEISRRQRSARRRVQAGGLTEAMGVLLRRDHDWLPNEGQLQARSAAREKRLSVAQLELIGIEEERWLTGEPAEALPLLLERSATGEASQELTQAARELLVTGQAVESAALEDLATLMSVLLEHEERFNQLLATASAYREFIEKSILWVRSTPTNPTESLLALPEHVAALGRSDALRRLPSDLWSAVGQRRAYWIGSALFLAALLAGRRLFERRRHELNGRVRSFRTDRYTHTVRALILTLLLVLPPPLLAWTVGGLLSSAADDLTQAIGWSLRDIAWVWLVLEALRGVLAENGVGQVHFRWPASSLLAVRRELRWFSPCFLVLRFLANALDHQHQGAWSDSVGRACFVGSMLALALLAHRLFRGKWGTFAGSSKDSGSILHKTHRAWSLLVVAIPGALVLLALVGYYYTALQFELRLVNTIVFGLGVGLANALLMRWLFMARRRLAVRQALDARTRRKEDSNLSGDVEAVSSAVDAEKVDLPAVDAQTRQLFKSSVTLATVVGFYLIWASVLPALQGLERIQLLPTPSIVSAPELSIEEPAPAPSDGGESGTDALPTSPGSPGLPIGTSPVAPEGDAGLPATLSLADLLLALVFVALTSVGAKNVPALLELSLLPRLPLDGGARYAVSTIVRYLILMAGLSAISGALGIGWQQIQWLAAALTFGLAFGLQEIFANFVSGLIILIERPIRVGDIVTVGSTEGRVTQLRMRATTVQDWDRRELLIPNKEFITGSVVNWTLTDPVTRIVIPVGVAYGSDTEKARELLLACAKESPQVLEDPEPTAIFRRFGESSLDLELRVFLPDRNLWPVVTHELHSKVDEAFREAGIVIAFPQRDVHVYPAGAAVARDGSGS